MAVNTCLWDERINRAEVLIETYPYCRQFLTFYRHLLLFQKDLYVAAPRQIRGKHLATAAPFQNCWKDLRFSSSTALFASFLSLIKRIGTQELSQVSDRILSSGEPEWMKLLGLYWEKNLEAEDFGEGETLFFFPKAFLQPYAQFLAERQPQEYFENGNEQLVQNGAAACPQCRRSPQLGILRTAGEGARRSLLCSLCATEWRYKRLCCAACGEENASKLSYYRVSDIPHVRLDACETCRKYMKSIDSR